MKVLPLLFINASSSSSFNKQHAIAVPSSPANHHVHFHHHGQAKPKSRTSLSLSSSSSSPPPPPLSPLSPLSQSATLKLFITGSTLGPIVDSLHNQCLLQYDKLPINIILSSSTTSTSTIDSTNSASTSYLFCTSAYIPLLLGIAYIVLGDILPKIVDYVLQQFIIFTCNNNFIIMSTRMYDQEEKVNEEKIKISSSSSSSSSNNNNNNTLEFLRTRAILAVTSTACIIKLSEILQTSTSITSSLPFLSSLPLDQSTINLSIMIIAVFIQWVTLDTTLSSLFTAILVSIAGPISELPFVATGFWHYIPSAADYYPFENWNWIFSNGVISSAISGVSGDDLDLVLSSITGPCYFAVTMDAIALGRWFNYSDDSEDNDDDDDYDSGGD